jgi:hypothetical protein
MSDEFFRTVMGRKFYEADVPRLIKALELIGDKLKPAAPKAAKAVPSNLTAVYQLDNERLLDLLRMLNRRIHQEEIAGHFPYSLIRNLAAALEGGPPFIPAHFKGREQPTLEDILGGHQRGIPGILFPVDNGGDCDSEDGKVFIAREDASMMFTSDVDAANFISCLIGKPWKKWFDQPGKDYYHPYFELTLDEVDRIHATYGSVPVKKETA